MNLKEQMMNEYQKKDSENIKEAMQKGRNEVFYGKDVITDDIRKEFQDGGFTVEDYRDKHSDADGLQLVRFSW